MLAFEQANQMPWQTIKVYFRDYNIVENPVFNNRSYDRRIVFSAYSPTVGFTL